MICYLLSQRELRYKIVLFDPPELKTVTGFAIQILRDPRRICIRAHPVHHGWTFDCFDTGTRVFEVVQKTTKHQAIALLLTFLRIKTLPRYQNQQKKAHDKNAKAGLCK